MEVGGIEFEPEQLELLVRIHILANKMETIKNNGKVHAVIALLEELSRAYIDSFYLCEKLNLLFDDVKFIVEDR